MPKTLASFCRLCLTKTSSKVPVFGGEQENVTNLLALIELSIDPESESNAAVCLNCMVTLEGFLQFKEQCHENDKFLKTVPPKDSGEVSEASESFEDGDAMECVFLDMNDDGVGTRDSEEDGLVEEAEPPPETSKKTVTLASPKKEATKTTQMQPEKLITSRRENLFGVEPMSRVRKQIAKPASSPRTDLIALGKVLQEQYRCPEPTENDLPKLLDSYPDTFHFVKSTPKSKFYTLVYYGEPYQSAVYEYNKTYYRCAYKRKFDCPAVLHASNDYTEFTRRFEHNHDEQEPIYSNLPPKSKIKPVLLTPRQALPDIFRRCWRKVEEKKVYRQHQHCRVFRKYRKHKKVGEKKPSQQQVSQNESHDSDNDSNEEGAWW